MLTLRSRLARGLERARVRAAGAPRTTETGAAPMDWKELLQRLLAVYVARSAQRVLERQAESPEQGRRGGVVSAPVAPTTLVAPPHREPNPKDKTPPAEVCRAVTGGPMATAKLVFTEFGRDNGTLMAAAVAFWFVLSIVPLGAVAIAIFGFVLHGQPGVEERVYSFLAQFFPGQGDLLRNAIQQVMSTRGTIGIAGLAGLVLTATGGFATLETAINSTWRTPNRNFFWNKLFALAMMLVIGLLYVLSFVITAVVQFAEDLPVLGWLAQNMGLRILGFVLPLLISGLMFTGIYRLFPNIRNRPWKPALIAGFITAFLWELFKHAYAWYSSEFITRGATATYGTLGSFIGLIMWIYYSSALVLLGSELTWALEGCPEGKPPAQPPSET